MTLRPGRPGRRALALALGLAVVTTTCTHVVPIVVVPLTTWTIPLSLDDDVRLCVATELGPFIDPADVRPLRCVSVGAVRAWIRGQRMANE